MDQRAEFSAATRKVIAGRAGYQCSVLNCGRLTVGPGLGSTDVVDIGMAAHIYAAAPGGPRGTDGLSALERSSPENGIWCCYRHGKAIDADNGNVVPAVQLRAWKRLHEARKGAEVHGVAIDRFGLVESILVNSGHACLSGRKFELGMRNVIIGPNDSGKTILARLIASVANPDHVAELSRFHDVDIAVRWFDPNAHDVSTIGRSGDVQHILDGRAVPYVARPYKTIMLSGRCRTTPSSLTPLAQLFDLSTTAMKATLDALPSVSDLVKEVRLTGSHVDFTIEVGGRTIRSTSAERGWPAHVHPLVVLELAGVHARRHAQVEPTFLLVDEFLDFLHPLLQAAALERVERAAEHAQVAVISHSPTVAAECGQNWKLTTLEHPSRRQENRSHQPIDLEVSAADPTA